MIELRGVTKSFGTTVAVDAFDLAVPRGARIALVGPSGCGKTTVLRIVAGLESPDAGEVRIGGTEATGPSAMTPPHARGLGFVFQEPALFPHLSVAANVAYGLTAPRHERRERVETMLDAVGLSGLADRRPDELSGGQQRRVAIARAMAPSPARLLMDEPLTNLDVAAREGLLAAIDALVAACGASLLYVTHDEGEAAALGCDLVRMAGGRRDG